MLTLCTTRYDVRKNYVLFTHRIYMFHVILIANADYVLIQQEMFGH